MMWTAYVHSYGHKLSITVMDIAVMLCYAITDFVTSLLLQASLQILQQATLFCRQISLCS